MIGNSGIYRSISWLRKKFKTFLEWLKLGEPLAAIPAAIVTIGLAIGWFTLSQSDPPLKEECKNGDIETDCMKSIHLKNIKHIAPNLDLSGGGLQGDSSDTELPNEPRTSEEPDFWLREAVHAQSEGNDKKTGRSIQRAINYAEKSKNTTQLAIALGMAIEYYCNRGEWKDVAIYGNKWAQNLKNGMNSVYPDAVSQSARAHIELTLGKCKLDEYHEKSEHGMLGLAKRNFEHAKELIEATNPNQSTNRSEFEKIHMEIYIGFSDVAKLQGDLASALDLINHAEELMQIRLETESCVGSECIRENAYLAMKKAVMLSMSDQPQDALTHLQQGCSPLINLNGNLDNRLAQIDCYSRLFNLSNQLGLLKLARGYKENWGKLMCNLTDIPSFPLPQQVRINKMRKATEFQCQTINEDKNNYGR